VYVDGVLKRDVAINLSFTEANNQTLYIGTLGPKSTPVNGITYWLPFGGLMDVYQGVDGGGGGRYTSKC